MSYPYPEDEPELRGFFSMPECPECDGTGTLVAFPDRFTRAYQPCPVCGGSGVIEPTTEEEPGA